MSAPLEIKDPNFLKLLLDAVRIQRDKLEDENERLRAALQFYADALYWDMAYRADTGEYVPANSDGSSCIEMDKGERARTVLGET